MKQCFRFDQRVNEDKQLRKLVQIVFAVRASSLKSQEEKNFHVASDVTGRELRSE